MRLLYRAHRETGMQWYRRWESCVPRHKEPFLHARENERTEERASNEDAKRRISSPRKKWTLGKGGRAKVNAKGSS